MNQDNQNNFRPSKLSEFIGHQDLISKIVISIDACKKTKEPFPHTLLTSGLGGTGKTSIAKLIGFELKTTFIEINSAGIEKTSDLISIIKGVPTNGVLFIDEVHSLPDKKSQECLLSVMEDFAITLKHSNPSITKIITIPVNKLTIIAATTNPGKLSDPFIGRFGITHRLDSYSDDEIFKILELNLKKIKVNILGPGILKEIAKRSRGIPRTAIRLLCRTRDYAISRNNGVIDLNVIKNAMDLENIDENGFSKEDWLYLKAMEMIGSLKPVGIAAISACMGQDQRTIQNNIEPFLMRLGVISIGKTGRFLTQKGFEILEKEKLIAKQNKKS